jgi:2-C-methyl-D-erythritol 4-phosphate cytidylyltransferase
VTGPDTAEERDVGVVIVAGGSGTRAGGTEPKQFRWVAGKPMLLHSVQTFLERHDVLAVVCVLPARYAGDPPPWLFQVDVERLLVSVGGRTRTESVFHGLEDLPDHANIVVVHDAARPLVGQATISRVIAEARIGHAATAALPVIDTIKEVADERRVKRTVPRDHLWRAQTPQAFPRDLLHAAHLEARHRGLSATDDAGLCEQLGHEVVVVRGSERAMKVTDEDDFARVEAWFPLPE